MAGVPGPGGNNRERLHHLQHPHLPTFTIMSRSVSVIGKGHNGFIYCIDILRLPCRACQLDGF
ncbi:hypothetical protein E2C01_050784 [Portunus trituberculatus]|uniref:Uncharacterized protein n=1 Tax=Portunus trituberculatus TaxID=210409 RepID=A0A5B7GIG2_PORTR|nr:hypothetical protein [Portunus trituberculatus]